MAEEPSLLEVDEGRRGRGEVGLFSLASETVSFSALC